MEPADNGRHSPVHSQRQNHLEMCVRDSSKGKTVIMIAHRLSTVAGADKIYVICDGQIAESGTSRDLLAQDGIFSRMWQNYQTSVQWKVAKEV